MAQDAADRPLPRRPRVSPQTLRERIERDPGPCCPECGGKLRVIGEDCSQMLDLIAAQLKVLSIARPKKSCRRCERSTQVPAPSPPIPGSMAGPGLLAHLRRDFHDEWDKTSLTIAREALDRTGALCDIERQITGKPGEVRLAAHQSHSAAKGEAFFDWPEQARGV